MKFRVVVAGSCEWDAEWEAETLDYLIERLQTDFLGQEIDKLLERSPDRHFADFGFDVFDEDNKLVFRYLEPGIAEAFEGG